jgi:hypothetical protein
MLSRPTRSTHFGFTLFITAVAIGGVLCPAAAGAQARIWEDRGPIGQLDLYWGNASPERVPIGPFTFVREDASATNPKAIVRDARGVVWGVKWDEEVQSEVAATRLAWAMGLEVEETYYVETGRIVFPGSRPTFTRIGSFVDGAGRFKAPARFERRDPAVVAKGRWEFANNPLPRDGGYAVLVLMNVVMANWDAKDDNNKVVSITDATGTRERYLVGDYGACFGKMGGEFSHSKYRLKDYAKNPPVVTGVSGETVHLGYKGKNAEFHESVPLEGARLFASRASQLSLKQVDDAFRAANANNADREGFARMVYDRFQQVVTSVR